MNTSLLATHNLSKQFTVKGSPFTPDRFARVVDCVNLELQRGETLGLAGESGCGKSTVARLMLGLIPPTSGEVFFRGTLLSAMGKAAQLAFRREVQMIFQDPYSSLNPRMRVGEIIAEPLIIHRLAAGNALREMVFELMTKVGLLPEHYDRYPHEFSGGQRQRIGIARALAVSPGVIVADEPVSALDISIQAQIINLLQDLQQEFALSYLFISRDLAVVRHVSSRIAVMYLGRIVELGASDAVFANFLHPYTEALLAAVPHLTREAGKSRLVLQGDLPSAFSPPTGCHFHPRCPHARELCRKTPPELVEKEPGHLAACHYTAELYR